MKGPYSFGAPLLLLLMGILFPPQSIYAQGESFYAGKNIRLVVGYGAATATDLWARLIARHMSKYIPGSPTIIVQNMPGATSLIAANQIYAMAKPDGLTLGVIAPALYFDQLVGRKEVQFDWAKLPTSAVRCTRTRSFSPEQMLRSKALRISVKPLCSRSAAQPEPRRPAITYPCSWNKLWVPISTLLPAIKAGTTLTLPLNEEKFSAAASVSILFLPGNLLLRGAR